MPLRIVPKIHLRSDLGSKIELTSRFRETSLRFRTDGGEGIDHSALWSIQLVFTAAPGELRALDQPSLRDNALTD